MLAHVECQVALQQASQYASSAHASLCTARLEIRQHCPQLAVHSKRQAGPLQAAIEVLQLLPNCGAFEIRISHKLLLDACLGQCEVPQELRQSALALLSTAAGASPMHPAARPKLWPSIKSVTHAINWDKALSSGICRQQLHVLLLFLQHCSHCLLKSLAT